MQFERISRWLWQSDQYQIRATGDHQFGRWKVVRTVPYLDTVGYARELADAMLLAKTDWRVQPGARDLTESHGRVIMGEQQPEIERTPAMTDTPVFNTCQCWSHYTEEERPRTDGETVTVRISTCCGSIIPKRRTFRPGHDAKYKAALLWAYRNSVPFIRLMDDGEQIESDPMVLAKERGWGHFMTQAKPKKKAKEADEVFAGDRGELDPDTLEPTEVEGFHPLRVKIGRSVKDAVLVSDEGDLVTVQYNAAKRPKDAKDLQRIQVARDKVIEGL